MVLTNWKENEGFVRGGRRGRGAYSSWVQRLFAQTSQPSIETNTGEHPELSKHNEGGVERGGQTTLSRDRLESTDLRAGDNPWLGQPQRAPGIPG